MKSKKAISVVLGVLLCMPSIKAYGLDEKNINSLVNKNVNLENRKNEEVKISKEKALSIARSELKNMFDLEFDEKAYYQNISLNVGNYKSMGGTWNIYWTTKEEGNPREINAVIDSNTGEVKSVNIYSENKNIPEIAKEEGKKIALDFIKKNFQDKFKEIHLEEEKGQERFYGSNYDYVFYRDINGKKYRENYFDILVDGITSKVIGFRCKWDADLKVDKGQVLVLPSDALETFKNNIDMKLNYLSYRDKYEINDKDEIKAIYKINSEKIYFLDAVTGKVHPYEEDSKQKICSDLNEEEREDFYKKYKQLEKPTSTIDEAEARKILTQVVEDNLGEEYKLESINYHEVETEKDVNKTWSAEFSKKDSDKPMYVLSVNLDASTGVISNLYSNEENMDDREKSKLMSWSELYRKAIDTVAKFYPDKIKDIDTSQVDNYTNADRKYIGRNCVFSFGRKVNGISYDQNNIGIWLDNVTGKITHVSLRWDEEANFPSIQNAISKDEARAMFFDKYEPKLQYKLVRGESNNEKDEPIVKPVYCIGGKTLEFNSIYNIDALNKKFIYYDGEEIDESMRDFMEKIKSSEYNKEITILAQQNKMNIKNFEPKKEVSKLDLIKMLVDVRGYNSKMLKSCGELKLDSSVSQSSKDYKYLQLAVSYGLLENSKGVKFDPNEKVTRLEAAKSFVKFADLQRVAKFKDIFKLQVNDINEIQEKDLSTLAIAKGMGALQVKDNKIRPNAVITMEEVAVGIYKILQNN